MEKTAAETDPDESTRMLATASFVGVLIIIGLPLWWKTTEVYRVALPYDEIAAFKNEPNIITTELTILANDASTADEIKTFIEQAFKNSDILDVKISTSTLSNALQDTLTSTADDEEALEVVCETLDCGRHNHLYLVQRQPLGHQVWVAEERVLLFKDSKASQTIVEVLSDWVYWTRALRSSVSERSSEASRRARAAPAPAYSVVTTVAHSSPSSLQIEFNAAEAVDDYIGTFVDELSSLHNFSLKSQWLHMMDFDFQAARIKLKNTNPNEWNRYFAVPESRLHLLLTRAEERTATQVSDLPTINLLLYVMPCDMSPVKIVDSYNNPIPPSVEAFMSPKWGGVYLASPPFAICNEIQNGVKPTWRPPVNKIMGNFIAHLRTLLGIVEPEPIQGAYLKPLRSVKPRKWEVDSLLRIRTLEQLVSAQLTLQSLAQLLEKISNIVINDEVGESIKSAVRESAACRRALRAGGSEVDGGSEGIGGSKREGVEGGGSLSMAHAHAQAAFLAAESAFTHPTLLELLYFPHDQKYAIYIPLFMPVMCPVVLSLKSLLIWLRTKKLKKEKTE